ncbi:MAG: sulfurtransferase [Candidatus Limnocylindria bacterium]
MTANDRYARPDSLVDTSWVAEHLRDPKVRLFEVDVDTSAYDTGHIEGALGLHWQRDLQQQPVRDILTKEQLEELLARHGVSPDTTVVCYGDNNNWFAAWAFWLLTYYGHEDVRLMNGGRAKWSAEGRPLTTDVPTYPRASYRAKSPRAEVRALRDDVRASIAKRVALVDVRSPKEFAGELLAPENLPQEGAQRGGHIPGARNIPWAQAVREDSTFKSPSELRALYEAKGITADGETIAYCRIGERSAHTWFVLTQLLGHPKVKNYDGSWTEWGSLIAAPIEREAAAV